MAVLNDTYVNGRLSVSSRSTFNGKVVITYDEDVETGSSQSGSLLIGSPTGSHLAFDSNEIAAFSSATAGSTLYLSANGQNTEIGGPLGVSGKITVSSGGAAITGGVTMSSTLSVTGKTTLSGDIDLSSSGCTLLKQDNSNEGGQLWFQGAGSNPNIYIDNYKGQFRFINDSNVGTYFVVNCPKASGTLALTSDLPTTLPANGGTANSAGIIANNSTFTKSPGSMTAFTWYNLFSTADINTSGLYLLEIYINSNSPFWSAHYSGQVTWFTGGTNGSEPDEIYMHGTSHAKNSDVHLYARTINTANSDGKTYLQIASNINLSSYTYTIKMTRLVSMI